MFPKRLPLLLLLAFAVTAASPASGVSPSPESSSLDGVQLAQGAPGQKPGPTSLKAAPPMKKEEKKLTEAGVGLPVAAPPASSSGVRSGMTPPPPLGTPSAAGGAGAAAAGGTAADTSGGKGGANSGQRQSLREFGPNEKFNFDVGPEMDMVEFVSEMSEKFKVNFILSDKVKGGKVTIISPNRVTREEAWQAFLSVLESKDLSLVRIGKFYKIIANRDAQRTPLKTYLEGGTPDSTEEIVTYLLRLKYVAVKDMEKILKDLKSKDASIITYEPTNTLIITDSGINIRRMIKLVNELDQPGGRDAIHVIDIYYASAADVAEKLQQIFGDKKGGGKSSTSTRAKSKPEGGGGGGTESGDNVAISNVIADERTNQLIIVAPREAMPRILDMINRLDVPIPGDGQVHVYYLENANAEELASTLTGVAGRGNTAAAKGGKGAKTSGGAGNQAAEMFEGEVKITADKATNSLVIVASTKDYNSLKAVIDRLDLRRRQVFVEAVIMEVTLKKDRAVGLSMNGGYTMNIDGNQVPLFGGTTLGSLSSILMNPSTLTGMAVGLRGPDLKGTEGLLGQGISLPAFGVLLQMIQTDSDANVLSTPHILTMDNEEAEIIVGSNVPFITGQARDSNNRPVLSIQRQDVALTMKIKPQINESNFVRLAVHQEITELVSVSETMGPTTTKRSAKSTVVVKDNQTIVIGGLLKDRETNDVEKVPFLGDIPILGRLFRRDKDLKEKTNLLIFLTPHIIKDEEDFKRIFKRKMDERNEFLRRFYGSDSEYDVDIDYSQKTGLIETIRSTYESEEKHRSDNEKELQDTIIVPDGGHRAYEIGFTEEQLGGSGETSERPGEDMPPVPAPDPGHGSGDDMVRRLTEPASPPPEPEQP